MEGLCCRKYAQEEAAQVFITDTLLTTLMCTPRSVYSWDIVITRAGGRLFFDKRDGSSLDLLTVAETSPEQIAEDKDNINGVQQLSLEATTLNQNFSQQVQHPLYVTASGPRSIKNISRCSAALSHCITASSLRRNSCAARMSASGSRWASAVEYSNAWAGC